MVLMRTSPALGLGMRNSSTVSGRPGSQNTTPRMKLGPPATWYPAAVAESDSAEKDRRRAPPIRRRSGRARRVEEEMDIGHECVSTALVLGAGSASGPVDEY